MVGRLTQFVYQLLYRHTVVRRTTLVWPRSQLLHMTPREEAVSNGCSDNTTFTLEVSADAWKDVKVKEKTKSKVPTFENERPIRIPDIVKRPCITTKFEKHATRDIGENTESVRLCVSFQSHGSCNVLLGHSPLFLYGAYFSKRSGSTVFG